VAVGDTVPVGAPLLSLADAADEDARADADAPAASEPVRAGAAAPPDGTRTADGRRRAAPVARRAAHRHGLDLERIAGTGPRGRITLRDVERELAAGEANGRPPASAGAPTAPAASGHVEPMSAMRAAIARRMTASQQIPQFALVRELDASWLLDRKEAFGGPAGIGVTDLLLQAMAEVLLRHPDLAATYVEPEGDGRPGLLRRDGADLGLAVATARGLTVPVVRRAHERSLADIAAERARLVGAARSGRLSHEDMGGATMTLSNLSSFGVDHFTAMVNPGEAAILAVGRVVERVVPRGRAIHVVPTLTVSLTIDHRVADGATGAAALVELAELLEGGMTWRP
jgi:pyruvate dehydrogenase E2 component (dihydrolipoamide acetyltransferase)